MHGQRAGVTARLGLSSSRSSCGAESRQGQRVDRGTYVRPRVTPVLVWRARDEQATGT